MDQTKSSHLRGMIWMVLSGLCFVGVYIGVKLIGTRLPAAESAFLRYALGLVFVLPALPNLLNAQITNADWRLFVGRGVVHTIAVTLWFFAMARLPIAEVAAMGYMTPVFVTLAAVLILGERLALRRALAIGVAILGVALILRPGFRDVQLAHLAMLATSVCFGLSYVAVKRLTASHSPTLIVALLSITVTVGLFPLALLDWVSPTWRELGWLLWVAAAATAGHFSMTYAFKHAPITVTQPVTFLQLVWSVTVGVLMFGEMIDVFVILGGTVIVAAVIYITFREAQLKRQTSG
ncbi:MAG: DMT family transporter [Pseudomonadota bacterium]